MAGCSPIRHSPMAKVPEYIGEIPEPQIMTIAIDVHKPFIRNIYMSSEK
jgi:hypothetical protein